MNTQKPKWLAIVTAVYLTAFPSLTVKPAALAQTPGDGGVVEVANYSTRNIEGWSVRVSNKLTEEAPKETGRAIQLLATQLKEVKRIVPDEILQKIITVPIWLSPPYAGFQPTGEYHPNADWLKQNGRLPELHRCVEFTNTSIFEREIERMPVMVLHELAHAYHDQVLGYDNKEIEAIFSQARENGTYNSVQRNNGTTEKAYAMSNPMEYFAELSEALLGRNDFYPFDRKQLERHDPDGYRLLARIWKVDVEPARVKSK